MELASADRPFQLHVGGALPHGRGRGWAESPAGIEYAVSEIAKVAKGKRGRAAIEAIVNRFERPADPKGEIIRALAALGSVPGGAGNVGPSPAPVPVQGASTPLALPQAPAGPLAGLDPQRQQLALSLLTKNSGLNRVGPDLLNEAFSRLTAPGQQAQPPQSMDDKLPEPQPGPGGISMVKIAQGADRHGVPTHSEVVSFVEQIAERYGKPLTIGTGSNHREYVQGRDHVQSDHWTGEAADIPMAGKQLTALGRAALVAAGADPLWAAQQTGGVYNIHGYQILFNTNVGGNHYNHLHVGLGRRLGRHP